MGFGKLQRLVLGIQLEKFWLSSYKVSICMKRLVGICCCLILLFASAAWALAKCQSLAAHHDGHEHSESVTHLHNHDSEFPLYPSLPQDQVIHCTNSRVLPSAISQPSTRITRPLLAYEILPPCNVTVVAPATRWIAHSEKRPPGSFLAAVSPYLSLSVLRV